MTVVHPVVGGSKVFQVVPVSDMGHHTIIRILAMNIRRNPRSLLKLILKD